MSPEVIMNIHVHMHTRNTEMSFHHQSQSGFKKISFQFNRCECKFVRQATGAMPDMLSSIISCLYGHKDKLHLT